VHAVSVVGVCTLGPTVAQVILFRLVVVMSKNVFVQNFSLKFSVMCLRGYGDAGVFSNWSYRKSRARVTLIFCRTLTLRHAHIEKHGEQISQEMKIFGFFCIQKLFLCSKT
jgi:hypothetical protein